MPSVEELRWDSRARAEARRRLEGLGDTHLVRLVQAQREEARRSTERQREEWEDAWRHYQSEISWADKEDWQSRYWIPHPWTSVEQAAAIIQRAMLDSPEFFGVEGTDPRDKQLAAQVWKPVLSWALQRSRFIPKTADAAKMALACGPAYLKLRYHPFAAPRLGGVDPQTGQPSFEVRMRAAMAVDTIPPWQIYRDPNSRARSQWSGSYLIHEEWVDWAYLAEQGARKVFRNLEGLGRAGGSSGGVASSGPGFGVSGQEVAQRRQQVWQPHEFRRPHLAAEWWGDVLDANGEVVYPDARMIVSGEALLFGPADNPLWAVDSESGRRKWPIIGLCPLSHPLRFEGVGILRAVTPLAALLSNLFNLFADGLNWSVNPETELDTSVLADWDDLERYPGKLWLKHGPSQALSPAQSGKVDVGATLAVLQYVNQLIENHGFVNHFVAGLPGTRSNITRGEVQIKTQQSMGMFDAMARNLESGITAAIEVALDLHLQYLTDWSDPTLVDIVGERNASALNLMDPAARWETLGGNFDFRVTSISAALQKADLLGRLMQVSQLVALPPYAGLTKPHELLQAIVDTLGLRDRIEVADQPMVPVAAAEQVLAKAMGLPPEVATGSGRSGTSPPTAEAGLPALPPSTRRDQPVPAEEEEVA